MIYLDNAATTYYKPLSVKKAVNVAMNLYTANAGRGAHKPAQICAEKIYDTRQKVLSLWGLENYNVIFTSGCTSALNLAILGTARPNGHIITTYLEHNSILRPLQHLKEAGVVDYTVLDDINVSSFEKAVRNNTYMIITTQASNVTGEILNIREINAWCKANGMLHLVDTAQGGGHIFDKLDGVDMIAFAGHKGLYGIGGVGGLVVREGIELKPIIYGGTGTNSESLTQPTAIPEGFEAGTLSNIPIISLGAGIDYVLSNKQYILSKEEKINTSLADMLNGLDFIEKYYANNNVGVYSFNIKNMDSSFVGDCLNEQFNICTRTGLHCAPLAHKHLGTLNKGAVRVSTSCDNTLEDIKTLERALKKIYSLKI